MPRSLLRTLTTTATSLVLLVLTALPALAASGTKPAADETYLIGSMEQLLTASIVGAVLGIIAFAMLPKQDKAAEDDHH